MLALITQTFHFLPQSRRSLAAKHRMRWRDDEEEEERGGEGRGGGTHNRGGEGIIRVSKTGESSCPLERFMD